MIEPIRDLPPGVAGFRAKGEITPTDYRDMVLPALKAENGSQGGRLLLVAGSDFDGYTGFERAASDEPSFKLDRIAFVSDRQMYGDAVNAFGLPFPHKAHVYSEDELNRAVEWLAEEN